MRSARVDSFAAAVLSQRLSGGDLAGLLRRFAAGAAERDRVAEDARAATAQARFTGPAGRRDAERRRALRRADPAGLPAQGAAVAGLGLPARPRRRRCRSPASSRSGRLSKVVGVRSRAGEARPGPMTPGSPAPRSGRCCAARRSGRAGPPLLAGRRSRCRRPASSPPTRCGRGGSAAGGACSSRPSPTRSTCSPSAPRAGRSPAAGFAEIARTGAGPLAEELRRDGRRARVRPAPRRGSRRAARPGSGQRGRDPLRLDRALAPLRLAARRPASPSVDRAAPRPAPRGRGARRPRRAEDPARRRPRPRPLGPADDRRRADRQRRRAAGGLLSRSPYGPGSHARGSASTAPESNRRRSRWPSGSNIRRFAAVAASLERSPSLPPPPMPPAGRALGWGYNFSGQVGNGDHLGGALQLRGGAVAAPRGDRSRRNRRRLRIRPRPRRRRQGEVLGLQLRRRTRQRNHGPESRAGPGPRPLECRRRRRRLRVRARSARRRLDHGLGRERLRAARARDPAGPETCNAVTCSKVPRKVPGIANAIAIAAYGYHSMALLADGTVLSWGSDEQGQQADGVGMQTGCFCVPTPHPIAAASGAVGIAAGYYTGAALFADGTVRNWGGNGRGDLGTGQASPATGCQCLGPVSPAGLPRRGADQLGRQREHGAPAVGRRARLGVQLLRTGRERGEILPRRRATASRCPPRSSV